jgi:predicted RNase H-like HicB family nuclease
MQFQRDGIRFQYPDNWRLTREDADTGWTVSVQSPDTAFFLVTLDEAMPDVEEVAQTVLEALKADYPELDAEDAVESIAAQPALGLDIRFFSLDLTNTCCTRALYAQAGTLLLMWQANDLEWENVEPIFRAVLASFKLDEPTG